MPYKTNLLFLYGTLDIFPEGLRTIPAACLFFLGSFFNGRRSFLNGFRGIFSDRRCLLHSLRS